MKEFEERGRGVFYSRRALTALSKKEIEWLKDQVPSGAFGRARICLHPDVKSKVHEMLIVHKRSGYVQPHRHPGKAESVHVVEGSATLLIFSDSGEHKESIALGRDQCILFRLETDVFHSFVFHTDFFVFHEVIEGPFQPGEAEFASWAPSEGAASEQEIQLFQRQLSALSALRC